ncbi:MAG TPA: DUF4147 domain-containing protein [Piscirickettsiaceae bacterium]|nr:DUF4147 domain-containing protein [Piscirickettsiaceae bacterium]
MALNIMASAAVEPLRWLNQGLAAVSGRRAVYRSLHRQPTVQPPAVIAIGKAAEAMLWGALDALAERALAPAALFGVSKYGHWRQQAEIERHCPSAILLEAAHPVPDGASLGAGEQLRRWCARQPADRPVWVLISGGASALVEAPVSGVTLAHLQRLNAWLLRSGWDIARMNAVRAAFSRLKGGGLAALLAPRPITGLMLSDVPADRIEWIGSGLLHSLSPPPPEDVAALPEPFCHLPVNVSVPVSPPACRIVASNALARQAVVRASGGQLQDGGALYGDVACLAARIEQAVPGQIFGGEATVQLPSHAPPGGRNQHLALLLAKAIAGTSHWFAALGTDGTDGTTDVAGAWVDGQTWMRAQQLGLDPDGALRTFDSHRVLQALGQTIHTGPTGTNVMDLMLWL